MKRITLPALLSIVSLIGQVALQISDYKNLALAYIFGGLTVGLLIWAFAVALENPGVMRWWPISWPWWGDISLHDAAHIAFRRLDGTVWTHFAQGQKTPDQRLDHMATSIIERVPAQRMYGRKPPAQHRPLSDVIVAATSIHGGGRNLHAFGNPRPSFEDIRITKGDLWRALAEMKREAQD